MTRNTYGLAVVIALLCGSDCGAWERRRGADTEQLMVNGMSRTFVVHLPKDQKAGDKQALIIALHGGGSNGKSMSRFSGLDDTADKHGFVVVYPDGSGRIDLIRTWNSGACEGYAKSKQIDDVAFMRALIRHMVGKYNVDPDRVFVTGMSNGAMMAYRLAAEAPDQISAVAAVSGTLDIEAANVTNPLPILHFHGTADQHVPFEGGHGEKSYAQNVHTSVKATLDAWIRVNGANSTPKEEPLPDKINDGTMVVKFTYGTAVDSESIVLYKIVGGGHTWPGRPRLEKMLGPTTEDISANEIMWKFFADHPRKQTDKSSANKPSEATR